MRFTNGWQRNADGVTEIIIVGAPTGNVSVKQLTERRRCPSNGMNAVGDRADVICRKHSAGNLTVAHSHTVHVSRESQRQVCHVQGVAFPGFGLVEQRHLFASENLAYQTALELVVAGGNRSVGSEDAHSGAAISVELRQAAGKALFEPSFKQSEA